VRRKNEDRVYVDDRCGLFVVADGVGGHAGGETAAELAIDVIRASFDRASFDRATLAAAGDDLKTRLASAIVHANNTIFEMAQGNEALRGMACVLTVAALDGDRFTVGHVGDSRLYLIWNGAIRKLTSDHSPIGEQEERGELTEQEAMKHPRRNEVFRDVGSRPRVADEEGFIEVKHFLFKPDAAVLMCSDGLSDVLTAAEINGIIEQYEGDPEETAKSLVAAANESGGADNISAIFIAGHEFLGSASETMAEARDRHAITRERFADTGPPLWRTLSGRVAFLVYGLLLGVLIGLFLALRWK
jgi:serine/threonine protein phosphatase PrpC